MDNVKEIPMLEPCFPTTTSALPSLFPLRETRPERQVGIALLSLMQKIPALADMILKPAGTRLGFVDGVDAPSRRHPHHQQSQPTQNSKGPKNVAVSPKHSGFTV